MSGHADIPDLCRHHIVQHPARWATLCTGLHPQCSNRNGTLDLFRATRPTNGAFALDNQAFAAINDNTSRDTSPVVTLDQLTVYWASDRSGGVGSLDVWKASRLGPSDPFGNPTDVTSVNTGFDDVPSWISDDGCRLYLYAGTTQYDVLMASRPAN